MKNLILILILIILFFFIKVLQIENFSQYNKLVIFHNSGFFSCCSVKLSKIVDYVNHHKKLPLVIDSSNQFKLYKPTGYKNIDVTYHYFKNYNDIKNIKISFPINYYHKDQYKDYSKLDYKNITPLIKKIFSPSNKIKERINYLERKYNVDYNNILAVYYRGTDKIKETKIASFNNFYEKILKIINKNRNIKILIQTDTFQFLDYIRNKNIKNIIVFKENKISKTNNGIHNEQSKNVNYHDMFNFLSTVFIISKCKYIICSSGNVSIWIMLFRGNNKNVIQYLNNNWYSSLV
tara:strand:+ start:2052 stop:2927 length:876 start_codon:yes stop_codon:yes gene_type:complete